MSHEGGRPTVMTEEVLQKLEYAFSIGCTDKEACISADIAPSTLYDYQEKNPEFAERKGELKEKLVLQARENLRASLEKEDPQTTRWYLERARKAEFSTRTEHTGEDGEPIKVNLVSYGDNSPVQLPTETLPATPTESDGLGVPEGDSDLAPESGQG